MKKINWVILIIVFVAIIGVYEINLIKNIKPHACTMEAKICPDGTAIGRSGPDCEFTPCPNSTTTPANTSLQNINIKAGDTVASPLQVNGEARGTWYFEASFPVKIYDANDKLLGSVPAEAQSDWMTENFVPFNALLIFTDSTTKSGTLVLEKDNPSDMPQNAGQIKIPIRFK